MMRRTPIPLLCVSLGLLGASLAARADFTFVHITDTHISTAVGPSSALEAVNAGFREIAALQPKPAFVANTGDVSETATPREYQLWQQSLNLLNGIPIHTCPGNHDVRWNPLGKEGYRLGTNQPLYQSWDHENVHFVLLDATVLLQHWGHVSRDQIAWLKNDLDKVGPDKPVVIGFHHWVGRESVQVDNEQELLDLVAPYNVVLWLQGHGHSDINWNVNGAPAIMAKGLYQGSYHLIEVTKDTMKVKRRTVGKAAGGKEILRDKSDATPAPTPAPGVPVGQQVVWHDLMTIPLAKRPAPEWQTAARNETGFTRVTASWSAALTKDVGRVEYTLNGGKPVAMKPQGPEACAASISTPDLVPGQQNVTVLLTLADGRQYQKPADFAVPGKVAPAWNANVGGAVQSHLVRAGDSLYVTTMGNDLCALDPATGKEQWRFSAADSIFSTPFVDPTTRTVYFGSADHFLYAVDTQTHSLKWKSKTDGAVLAGAAVAQGVVCVGSVDQYVYGFDASSGVEKWKVKGGNMYQSNAASDGKRFFVGGWDNTFRAIDAATGNLAWEKKVGRDTKSGKILFYFSPAIASPAVGAGKVYVTSNDGVLHAFDCATGDIVWEFDGKKLGYSSPIYLNGKVYVAIGDEGKTFCLNAKNGNLVWESDHGPVIYDSGFTHANGKLFIGAVNGTFRALDANTGAIAWQYRLGPGHVFATPTADESHVYIGSLSGQVTALPVK